MRVMDMKAWRACAAGMQHVARHVIVQKGRAQRAPPKRPGSQGMAW